MDRQEMVGLYESYMSVYEKNESCDDYEDVEKEEEGEKEEKKSEPKEKKDKAKDKKEMKESSDLYDLVLEYLLDEGLCESVENAEIMMAHMSEGWVDSIVEGFKPTQYNTSGNIFAGRTRKASQIDSQIKKLKSKGRHSDAQVIDILNRSADSQEGREDSIQQSNRNKSKMQTRALRDAQKDEKESRKGR